MTQMRKLEQQVGTWPHVSVHPHRFDGREFRFGDAELPCSGIGRGLSLLDFGIFRLRMHFEWGTR